MREKKGGFCLLDPTLQLQKVDQFVCAKKRKIKKYFGYSVHAQDTKCSVLEESGAIALKFGNRAYTISYLCIMVGHMFYKLI